MAGFNLFKRMLGNGDRNDSLAPRAQASQDLRVLVVDDSPTIRAVLGKMLGLEGYSMLYASDGDDALAQARREQPGLIFLDIVMPGTSGFNVLRTLRKEAATASIPIVMISGNLQATEQQYVQRFGADDFLKKPFGRDEVYDRIAALVDAGRLPARDPGHHVAPVIDPALPDLDSIGDVALPDADDPAMSAPVADGLINTSNGTP